MPTDITINLWKQHLGTVPDEIWERTNATVLILADNSLTEISSRVGRMQHLRTLDLGHNQLASLPEEIGELTALSDFLYLHDNRLTSLPSSIATLARLRYLNISENQLSVFPDAICQMSGLLELRATDNQISQLPASIDGMAKLRELHLRNNRLRTLPEEIAGCSELRQIDLRGNPIEALPGVIAQLPKLEKLDLRWVTTLEEPAWMGDLEARDVWFIGDGVKCTHTLGAPSIASRWVGHSSGARTVFHFLPKITTGSSLRSILPPIATQWMGHPVPWRATKQVLRMRSG